MRNCFVLGSGRSGTSMVAGAIAGAGYFVGDDLIGARPANPKGFFEDREINRINEDLLDPVVKGRPSGATARLFRHRTRYGQRWLAAVPLSAGPALDAGGTDAIRARIGPIVSNQPFCFKDPRFSYTLGVWQVELAEPAAQVCVFREPGRTAESVVREIGEARYLRDLRLDRRRILEMWTLAYRHVIDRHRDRGPTLFVHYDQIVEGSALDRLDELLGTTVDRSFADAAVGRSTAPAASEGSDGVPAAAARTYAELCALAGYEAAGGR
jgi:hypothetical protein